MSKEQFDDLLLTELKDGKIAVSQYHYVEKKWGLECWIVNCPSYCMKILNILSNCCSSIHYHKIKDETFHVISGTVRLQIWNDINDFHVNSPLKEIILSPGCSFRINPGLIHRFYSYEDSQIIEISTQHFEEDSYRLSESKNELPNDLKSNHQP